MTTDKESIQTTEYSSPTDRYKYSVQDLLAFVPPFHDSEKHNEGYFRVCQAFDRLKAAGLSLPEIVLQIDSEAFQTNLDIRYVARLMQEKREYFQGRDDSEQRFFLIAGANTTIAHLTNRLFAMNDGLIDSTQEERNAMEAEYLATMQLQNLTYQPQTEPVSIAISQNGEAI